MSDIRISRKRVYFCSSTFRKCLQTAHPWTPGRTRVQGWVCCICSNDHKRKLLPHSQLEHSSRHRSRQFSPQPAQKADEDVEVHSMETPRFRHVTFSDFLISFVLLPRNSAAALHFLPSLFSSLPFGSLPLLTYLRSDTGDIQILTRAEKSVICITVSSHLKEATTEQNRAMITKQHGVSSYFHSITSFPQRYSVLSVLSSRTRVRGSEKCGKKRWNSGCNCIVGE